MTHSEDKSSYTLGRTDDLEEIKAQQPLAESSSGPGTLPEVAESSSAAFRRQQQQQAIQQPLSSVASSSSFLGRLTSFTKSFFKKREFEGESASTEEGRKKMKLKHDEVAVLFMEKRKREQEAEEARKKQRLDVVDHVASSSNSSTLAVGVQADSSAVMPTTVPAAPVIDLTEEEKCPVLAPEDRQGASEGLSITLLEHQKIGLQWMLMMEKSTKMGGILADDTGLGKTVQAIAAIVENPSKHPDLITGKDYTNLGSDEKLRVKATLVVCPVSLMDQWKREIEEKTCPVLKVMVHHGSERTSLSTDFVDYDVIISSYSVVAGDFSDNTKGPVSKAIFHRVILDEAHFIKNKNAVVAKGCCKIDADHRWCLTAAPIQNKIEELYSFIRFLKIKPFCDWTEFKKTILKPMRSGHHARTTKVIKALIKEISLCRSKKAIIDGRPVLELPERNVHLTHIDFSPEERSHYQEVESQAQEVFRREVWNGTVMSNYPYALSLLLRLRQSCLHPHLTLKEAMADGPEDNLELELEVARSMESEVVTRLCNEIVDVQQVDCPVCLDVAQVAQILRDCGHAFCKECLESYLSSMGGGTKRCPQCRGDILPENVVSLKAFATVHAPHLLNEPKPDDKGKEKEEIDFVSSTKINKMIEILKETKGTSNNTDKAIVFSQFTSFLNLIESPLKANGFKYLRYDGSVSAKQRVEVIRQFHNDPEYTVLIASTKCGSLGLNLTCASRVIMMDVSWNPALENQAIDRVHRIGQTKPVDVYRIIVNDTVEERIIDFQTMKQSTSHGVLGECEGRLRESELSDLLQDRYLEIGPGFNNATGWPL